MLDASLDYLAATDWASLGTQAHGEMLAQLQRTQTRLTAVNAAVLAAFTAQAGYEPDGHRSARAWLIGKTGISTGAAGGAVGWQRRIGRAAQSRFSHPDHLRPGATGNLSCFDYTGISDGNQIIGHDYIFD